LAIQRLQPLYQYGQALEHLVLIGDKFAQVIGRHALNLFDADQHLPDPSLPNHVPGGYVMGHAVYPGSQ
jgi:hypothetical protein